MMIGEKIYAKANQAPTQPELAARILATHDGA